MPPPDCCAKSSAPCTKAAACGESVSPGTPATELCAASLPCSADSAPCCDADDLAPCCGAADAAACSDTADAPRVAPRSSAACEKSCASTSCSKPCAPAAVCDKPCGAVAACDKPCGAVAACDKPCGAVAACDKPCSTAAACDKPCSTAAACDKSCSTTAACDKPCSTSAVCDKPCGAAAAAPAAAAARARLTRIAIAVAVFSFCYCTTEGVVSVIYGSATGANSLLVFGVDSLIEMASAALVVVHLLDKTIQLERERKIVLAIGSLLILLGAASVAASVAALVRRAEPDDSVPSLAVGAASTAVMLAAWAAKSHLAKRLGSEVVASDAMCSLSCSALSAVVLVGGIVFRSAPSAWWVDSALTLVLVGFFVKEGAGMIAHARSPAFAGGACACGA